jgi:hypothetical protein
VRATIDVCGYAHICLVLALRKTECPVEGIGTEESVRESLVASDLAPAKERSHDSISEGCEAQICGTCRDLSLAKN